ncbi:PAAR domain-containing protein [Sorangium sp. So ce1000]|uniref:PAAR domain-containing protein n=1 Tax=Sorangium sp. So ce1000 TaxID=3133325 RepID=UPI003F5D9B5C
MLREGSSELIAASSDGRDQNPELALAAGCARIVPPPRARGQRPPSNQARVRAGSKTVLINNKPAAHLGDPAVTCNDPGDAPNGSVIASGTVLVGDEYGVPEVRPWIGAAPPGGVPS